MGGKKVGKGEMDGCVFNLHWISIPEVTGVCWHLGTINAWGTRDCSSSNPLSSPLIVGIAVELLHELKLRSLPWSRLQV